MTRNKLRLGNARLLNIPGTPMARLFFSAVLSYVCGLRHEVSCSLKHQSANTLYFYDMQQNVTSHVLDLAQKSELMFMFQDLCIQLPLLWEGRLNERKPP